MASHGAVAYRLVSAAEWADAQAAGSYAGSALDLKDGYMHLSPPGEVRGTLDKYFAGRQDMVLLKIGAWWPPATGEVSGWTVWEGA
jgi:uncharacterized protein (DUF952 family)